MSSKPSHISERHQKMRSRNLAVGGILAVMVVVFFIVSIVKLQGAG